MADKEVKIDEVSINDVANDTAPVTEQTDPKIDELNQQITSLNDKYLRLAAELENTRRRAALDVESVSRNRVMDMARKILPVMDAVDAALKHNPDDIGIQSMARALESAFAQIGIVKIESVGQVLNPTFHNAIQVVAVPADADPAPAPNTIAEEMQTGYMFGENVLRTAMVVVYK